MEAAVFAIIGVVVGASVNALYQRWNDAAKWKREQSVRFHDQRMEAYGTLLDTVDKVTDFPEYRDTMWKLDGAERHQEWDARMAGVNRAMQRVMLLAGQPVRDLARDTFGKTAFELAVVLRDMQLPNVNVRQEEFTGAYLALITAMRTELGTEEPTRREPRRNRIGGIRTFRSGSSWRNV